MFRRTLSAIVSRGGESMSSSWEGERTDKTDQQIHVMYLLNFIPTYFFFLLLNFKCKYYTTRLFKSYVTLLKLLYSSLKISFQC